MTFEEDGRESFEVDRKRLLMAYRCIVSSNDVILLMTADDAVLLQSASRVPYKSYITLCTNQVKNH